MRACRIDGDLSPLPVSVIIAKNMLSLAFCVYSSVTEALRCWRRPCIPSIAYTPETLTHALPLSVIGLARETVPTLRSGSRVRARDRTRRPGTPGHGTAAKAAPIGRLGPLCPPANEVDFAGKWKWPAGARVRDARRHRERARPAHAETRLAGRA